MSSSTHVAIIGAGPYGLSIATHLRARAVDFRIFGAPLQSWRAEMPKGMFLKSEGFASNLYDADDSFTLKRFCAEHKLAYADENSPVPLDTFVAYSTAFQQKFVPEVEDEKVIALEQMPAGFRLSLDNGETLTARHVVVAAGLTDFRRMPAELANLPSSVLTHSAEHHDLSGFAGRDVSVVGGGASALDVVASLRAAGANARLISRRPALKWNMPVEPHAWRRFTPMSGMGGGWRNYFFEHAPMVFQHLPQHARLDIVRRWLGPSGAWPARKYVEQGPVLLGQKLRGADYRDGRAYLRLVSHQGVDSVVATDHVIAATGFKVDLNRLKFLGRDLQSQLRSVDSTPVLSSNFESSVSGLHFVGLASANTFGPLMRFLLGARYTARRLSRHFGQANT
jgi:lysine/ornithine N-monooxygenase